MLRGEICVEIPPRAHIFYRSWRNPQDFKELSFYIFLSSVIGAFGDGGSQKAVVDEWAYEFGDVAGMVGIADVAEDFLCRFRLLAKIEDRCCY